MRAAENNRRVLLVLEAALGGTGRHILDLAKGLLERDNEVHLIYSTLRADIQFQRGLERLHSEWPEFRSAGLRISRAVTPGDLVVFLQLFLYLRRNGPFDVIHGHSTKAGFLARLVPGVGNAAKVYTPHALMTMDPWLSSARRRAVSLLESLLARRSHRIIVVSRDEWRCALETGLPGHKLALIENGVDLTALSRRAQKRMDIRASLGIPAEAFCVGLIARLTEQKKPMRILEAFSIARRKSKVPVKLVVIGYGPLESALKTRAVELELQRDVIWAGPIDGAAYVAAFDVLAHASLYEAFAYVFLEALGSGVPFVSTRVGVSEELAQSGSAGLVCEPWDAEQFARLLLLLIENPGLRASMSEAAKKVVEAFDLSRMLNKISDLYESIAPIGATRVDDLKIARNSR